MSDPNVTVTPEATITVDPTAPKQAPVAHNGPTQPTGASNQNPAAPASEKEPQWLGARLERERKKVLADLGIEDVEDGKKAIADLKARKDAEKTAAQKAAEFEGKFKTTEAERQRLGEALTIYAKAQLAGLSETQRAAVTSVAGEDPAAQLKAIEALTPTWKAAAAPVATSPTALADTAPRPNAPSAPTTSPPDPKAIHAELAKTNPIIAARYALAHGLFDTK